jgi:hypothetical protein
MASGEESAKMDVSVRFGLLQHESHLDLTCIESRKMA